MVQVWKSASQVLAFSFATYPPKRAESAQMKFCEIQNAFHCWEGSRCILYTDNGMHRVRMEPMAGHFFCFPTSFFFAPCFWSRLGQNSSGTLPCGSTKLMFFGCATCNSKKLMFLGRGLHRWRTIVCNAGRLQAGGGAMQCNAMQARHMKAGGGLEVKKFILRRQLQESPGLMAVRSPPPEDVLQLWLLEGPSSSHVCTEYHNDGQFFRAMEWLMFFFRPPLPSMFFNGFDKVGPSPLNVFLGVQPLEPMVFQWFSKFWGQWSTMVLRLTMESLVKIISPNDDNIISRYFKELWKIR